MAFRVSVAGVKIRSKQVGSQQTNVSNVSDQYLGMEDVSDGAFDKIAFEVKLTQASGSDESGKFFKLFWAFSSQQLSNPNQAPTLLQNSEYSLLCGLGDATGGAITRHYMSDLVEPHGPYVYVWYDCDSLTNALTSVDVYLILKH